MVVILQEHGAMAAIRIGTSGWVYRHWRERFYPKGLRAEELLPFYAHHFDTVEINYSFYRLPTRQSFETWASATPPGFCFAVKASRFLTHMKKLRDPEPALARLFERASGLGGKLGPVLYQFPSQWKKNVPRLAAFLDCLPRSARHAFEFRHPSWLAEDVFQALRDHGCALCIPDAPWIPAVRQITAPFTYVRFHHGAHSANYSEVELASWSRWIAEQSAAGIEICAYFNNDVEGYAVVNAQTLKRLVAAT